MWGEGRDVGVCLCLGKLLFKIGKWLLNVRFLFFIFLVLLLFETNNFAKVEVDFM